MGSPYQKKKIVRLDTIWTCFETLVYVKANFQLNKDYLALDILNQNPFIIFPVKSLEISKKRFLNEISW